MKIRRGFVSNSSSSSFIIAIDKDKDLKIKLEIEVDLRKICDIEISSESALLKYLEELWWENPEDWSDGQKKDYHDMLSYIREGKIIIDGTVSNESDDYIENLLIETGIKRFVDDDIIVIQDCEGF